MRNILTVTITALFIATFAVTAFPVAIYAQENNDARRLELARQMHVIRPVEPQIADMVEAMSVNLPEDRREIFVLQMTNVFDRKTLNDISIKAMADTFTVAELEAMIGYFGTPEGKSAGEKMPVYWALVQPEIAKLMDKAMMDIRLGPANE